VILLGTPKVLADTSIATITLAGVVPSYFSVTLRGQPGELDLTPGITVSNRVVGLLHFKYNQNVQSLTISSSTASGKPENSGGTPYNFGGGGGFKVGIMPGCVTVDPTYNTPFVLTQAGTDVKSVASTTLTTQGVEEDCQVTATYTGTNTSLPMAGLFTLNILVTMISQ
jgi:hypothetical protein